MAYLRGEICVSKSIIGLALWLEVNLPYFLCFTLYVRVIIKYKLPWGLYLGGDFTVRKISCITTLGPGLYMEGLIFRILWY